MCAYTGAEGHRCRGGHYFFYIPGRRPGTEGAASCFDGTLYTNDEMNGQGLLNKTVTARHMNMSESAGSIEQIAPLGIGRKIFIHIVTGEPR